MSTMAERRRRCRELQARYYGHVPSREEVFDAAVTALIKPSDVLLDAGCGSDLPFVTRYAPKVAQAVGVDLCHPRPNAPARDRAVVGNLEQLPIGGASVDVIISRSVVEHLDHPEQVFAEFARILRRGGRLIFTTPNKYYYSCLVALLTPEALKAAYFRRVFGPDAYDHFPVRYRANTERAFRALAKTTRLRLARITAVPHYPYDLMFSPTLFRLGVMYDKIITRLGLEWLQSTWLVVMEKA